MQAILLFVHSIANLEIVNEAPGGSGRKGWNTKTYGNFSLMLGAAAMGRGRAQRVCLYQCPDVYFSGTSPRAIRPDRGVFSCMRSARVDLLRSRLHFVDFGSGLAVPSEDMHFQHLETP